MTLMAVERKWGGVDNLTSEWEVREVEGKGGEEGEGAAEEGAG